MRHVCCSTGLNAATPCAQLPSLHRTLTAQFVALQAGHPQVRHAAVGAPGRRQRAGQLIVVQATATHGRA